jgi:hypothetical protein
MCLHMHEKVLFGEKHESMSSIKTRHSEHILQAVCNMSEFVQDLLAFEIHRRRIQPFGGTKQDLIKASTSGCRVAYNLYIGSIMNREACFSTSIQEEEQDLCIHSIQEDAEDVLEYEFFCPQKDGRRS